jgi:hypothetical protein
LVEGIAELARAEAGLIAAVRTAALETGFELAAAGSADAAFAPVWAIGFGNALAAASGGLAAGGVPARTGGAAVPGVAADSDAAPALIAGLSERLGAAGGLTGAAIFATGAMGGAAGEALGAAEAFGKTALLEPRAFFTLTDTAATAAITRAPTTALFIQLTASCPYATSNCGNRWPLRQLGLGLNQKFPPATLYER